MLTWCGVTSGDREVTLSRCREHIWVQEGDAQLVQVTHLGAGDTSGSRKVALSWCRGHIWVQEGDTEPVQGTHLGAGR